MKEQASDEESEEEESHTWSSFAKDIRLSVRGKSKSDIEIKAVLEDSHEGCSCSDGNDEE
jgi:hypothetical protein